MYRQNKKTQETERVIAGIWQPINAEEFNSATVNKSNLVGEDCCWNYYTTPKTSNNLSKETL